MWVLHETPASSLLPQRLAPPNLQIDLAFRLKVSHGSLVAANVYVDRYEKMDLESAIQKYLNIVALTT